MDTQVKSTHSQNNQPLLVTMEFNDILSSVSIRFEKGVPQAIQTMKNKLIKKLDVPELYKDSTIENFDPKYKGNDNTEIFKKIKKLVSIGIPESIILWSNHIVGLGKTHLLYSMVKAHICDNENYNIRKQNQEEASIEYIGDYCEVVSEISLISRIRATYQPDSRETEFGILKELNNADILAIDDFLKYTPSNLDFYRRIMFQIIDYRYTHKKTLLVTTNNSLIEIGDILGAAISDRLADMTVGRQFEFKGISHRG